MGNKVQHRFDLIKINREQASISSEEATQDSKIHLNDDDYTFLMEQTHLERNDIENLHKKFLSYSCDGKLNKKNFVKLYSSLRPEADEQLKMISEYIFDCFDLNHDGYVDFYEFIISFTITNNGCLRKRLEYLFYLYDRNSNGYLEENEIEVIIKAMIALYGFDKNYNETIQSLVEYCIDALGNEVTKSTVFFHEKKINFLFQNNLILFISEDFIACLSKNYYLRSIMSPFN